MNVAACEDADSGGSAARIVTRADLVRPVVDRALPVAALLGAASRLPRAESGGGPASPHSLSRRRPASRGAPLPEQHYADGMARRAGSGLSLFWRVFLANAAVLVAGIVVLAAAPVSVSTRAALPELLDLVGALLLMVVVNWLVLRQLFRPLGALAARMNDADLLRGGARVPVEGAVELRALQHAFNEMMERLETERRVAGTRALRAQEDERQRIARELHDEVGQAMTGVLFQLKRVAGDARPERREQLAEAQATVRATLEDVGRMARELRPEALDHLGLPSALAALTRSFSQRTGIAVRRSIESPLPPLDAMAELAVYRVVQEGLTNVARHSGAREVVLSLAAGRGIGGEETVVLRLADDGRGFDGGRAAACAASASGP